MVSCSRAARLGVAMLVGMVPALVFFVGAAVLVAQSSSSDGPPATLVLGAAALVSLAVYIGAIVATFVTSELLTLFGEPTSRRLHGWALLPGVASVAVVLTSVQPMSVAVAAAATLAGLLAWQVLLWSWWRMARWLTRRNGSAGTRPISP